MVSEPRACLVVKLADLARETVGTVDRWPCGCVVLCDRVALRVFPCPSEAHAREHHEECSEWAATEGVDLEVGRGMLPAPSGRSPREAAR